MTQHFDSRRMTAHADVKSFVLAGNSTFTLVSQKSNKRFTYRVRVAKDNPNLFFVSVLNGPDNESSYGYFGLIRAGKFAPGRPEKVKVGKDALSVRAFAWFFDTLMAGEIGEQVEFWHEGKCCRCGRKLTVPSSIAKGIGPECVKHVGHTHAQQGDLFVAEAA